MSDFFRIVTWILMNTHALYYHSTQSIQARFNYTLQHFIVVDCFCYGYIFEMTSHSICATCLDWKSRLAVRKGTDKILDVSFAAISRAKRSVSHVYDKEWYQSAMHISTMQCSYVSYNSWQLGFFSEMPTGKNERWASSEEL